MASRMSLWMVSITGAIGDEARLRVVKRYAAALMLLVVFAVVVVAVAVRGPVFRNLPVGCELATGQAEPPDKSLQVFYGDRYFCSDM